MSKTSSKVKNAWNARNYDRITIVVPKGQKDHVQRIAQEKGYKSTGDYIKSLIQADTDLILRSENLQDV